MYLELKIQLDLWREDLEIYNLKHYLQNTQED